MNNDLNINDLYNKLNTNEDELDASMERFYIKDRNIEKEILALPRVSRDDIKNVVQPGDLIVVYPRSLDTAFSKMSYKLNTFVQRSAFSSVKMIGMDNKVIGYGVKDAHSVNVITLNTLANNYKGIIILRHKKMTPTLAKKIYDWVYDKLLKKIPYDYNGILRAIVKRLFRVVGLTVNTDEIDQSIRRLYCSTILHLAYKKFKLDTGMKNLGDFDIFPKDYLYSNSFKKIGLYLSRGELQNQSFSYYKDIKKELEPLASFKYGLYVKGKGLVTDPRQFNDLNPRSIILQNPDMFIKNQGGMCHDATLYLANFFTESKQDVKHIYLETDKEPNHTTHTFTIVKTLLNKWCVIDIFSINGCVYSKEFQTWQDAAKFRINKWITEEDITADDYVYAGVLKSLPPAGCNLLEFMEHVNKNSTNIPNIQISKSTEDLNIEIDEPSDPIELQQEIVASKINKSRNTLTKSAIAKLIITKYTDRTLKHKQLVKECGTLLLPYLDKYNIDKDVFLKRLDKHDDDKLENDIAPIYAIATQFEYNPEINTLFTPKPGVMDTFEKVLWPKHYTRNEHHVAEHFGEHTPEGEVSYLVKEDDHPLPIAEMIADWMAMGIEMGNTANQWWKICMEKNKYKFATNDTKMIEDLLQAESEILKKYKETQDLVEESANEAFVNIGLEQLEVGVEAAPTGKKKAILDYICKHCDIMDPSKYNSERYRRLISGMTDKQFDTFMRNMRDGKFQLHLVAPNMKVNLKIKDMLSCADNLKLKLFHRIWIRDKATGKRFLTDNKYLVLKLPVRRQEQFIDKKMSVPDNDKTIDGLTGQVSWESKATSLTNPEIQIMASRNMDASLHEFLNIRGGNINSYAEFKRSLEENGEARLNDLDPTARTRTAVMGGVLLTAMLLDSNL